MWLCSWQMALHRIFVLLSRLANVHPLPLFSSAFQWWRRPIQISKRHSGVWLRQENNHPVSAYQPTAWWLIAMKQMQIYKKAESKKRTCHHEWQVATDSGAATRMGWDLDVTVLTAPNVSLSATTTATFFFLFLPDLYKLLPSCTCSHLTARRCRTWSKVAKGGGRGGRKWPLFPDPSLRWVTFVIQGCAVVISLSVGTGLS